VTATLAHRAAAATAALLLTAVPAAAPAAAIPAPVIDLAVDIAPPDTDPAPAWPMKQSSVCATSAVLADSQFNSIPAAAAFSVDELHNFARGDGQIVAVIDSGVAKVSRLTRLRGGGDYIMSGDGLSDCDHHGTLIAGIIAAAPAPGDKFVGVAPGAEIVSIRQTSAAFAEENPPQGRTEADRSAANMMSLAKSIVHAANLGATVINLSVTACVDAGSPADLRALAGALQYAAVEKNAVIVSAAGNVGNSCQTNPGYDPANPGDPRNWDGVKSVSLPSYFSNLVLSVAGSDLTGAPYVNTMRPLGRGRRPGHEHRLPGPHRTHPRSTHQRCPRQGCTDANQRHQLRQRLRVGSRGSDPGNAPRPHFAAGDQQDHRHRTYSRAGP